MMSKFVIILLVYFYDGAVSEVNTSYYFENALECAKTKGSEEFKQHLKQSFKGKGVNLVESKCKMIIDHDLSETFAGNNSYGLCAINACLWF